MHMPPFCLREKEQLREHLFATITVIVVVVVVAVFVVFAMIVICLALAYCFFSNFLFFVVVN